MRTTIDIDDPILNQIKALQRQDGRSLGRLVSDLLAKALATEGVREASPQYFQWIAKSLNPRVDLDDKDAIRDLLDSERVASWVAERDRSASDRDLGERDLDERDPAERAK